jgi:ankyrin repeat protein
MYASAKGRTAAVKLLLDRGANVHAKNNVSTSDNMLSVY